MYQNELEFSAFFTADGWTFSHSGLSEHNGRLYSVRDFDREAIKSGMEPRGPYLIFDGERLETDLYGQMPLFVNRDAVKSGIFYGAVQHDPLKSVEFVDGPCFAERNAPHLKSAHIPARQPSASDIAEEFRRAVILRAEDGRGKIGLLLSGGVDSSAIATILAHEGYDFTAFCVSAGEIPYGKEERRDITAARRLSKRLGFDLAEIVLDIDETEAAIPEIYRIIDMKEYLNSTPVYLPVITALSITYYFALRAVSESGFSDVFAGTGSEEIFAGFVNRTGDNLNEQVVKKAATIYHRDMWRDYSLASRFSLRLSYPFLDNEVVKLALSIDAENKVIGGHKKYIWRRAAEILDVPPENAWRQNRATQYGSGADRILERIVRRSGKRYRVKYLEDVLEKMARENL